MVYELVKLQGGSISVESEVGIGSTFTIQLSLGKSHLPADQVVEPDSFSSTHPPFLMKKWHTLAIEELTDISSERPLEKPTNENMAVVSSAHSQQPKIMVVDDNRDMQTYLTRLLNQSYDVRVASDGYDALHLIGQQLPDLIIADVMMPGLDGVDLLQKLRNNPQTQTIPIIFLSARAGEEAIVEGLMAGADDYLVKPFNARELLARIRTQLDLARLRTRFESVLAGITEAFGFLDTNLKYLYVNQSALQHTNLVREEVIGKNILDVFPDLIASDFHHHLLAAIADSQPRTFEFKYAASGRWWEARLYPSHEGISYFIANITDSKQAQQNLMENNHRLAKANETLDTFVHIAAHDLKAPVNNLRILVERLAKVSDETKREKLMEMLALSITRMGQTLSGLVEIIQIQTHENAGTYTIEFETIWSIVQTELAEAIKQYSARIEVDFSQGPNIVYVEAYLVSIIKNLVSNALKYSSPKRIPHIRMLTQRTGHELHLSIHDNGIGLDLASCGDNLFKPFKRFTMQSEGTGLGLYVVKNMVERNGGRLEVSSQPDDGTTFNLYLKDY